jgi:hypothetical protein
VRLAEAITVMIVATFTLAQFGEAGIDVDALARQLQTEGAETFVKSRNDLMSVISSKGASLNKNRTLKAVGSIKQHEARESKRANTKGVCIWRHRSSH